MKHKHKDIDGSRRLFEIEIPSDTVKKKYEEIYDHIRKIANIPGYRKGKAPRDLLERHHGQKIKDETIQDLISHSYRHALKESDTDVLGIPEVSELSFDLEKGIFFKVKVDLRPKITLKKYKGISIKKQKLDVKESDVDKYLSVLREANPNFKEPKGDELEKLKKVIRADIARRLENAIRYDMERQILDQLLKEVKLEIPENVIKKESERLMKLKRKEDPITDKQIKEQAVANIKLYFILEEITKREGIKQDKVMDFLVENANISIRKGGEK